MISSSQQEYVGQKAMEKMSWGRNHFEEGMRTSRGYQHSKKEMTLYGDMFHGR